MNINGLDISYIPFTTRGSWTVVNYLKSDYYVSYFGSFGDDTHSTQADKTPFITTPGLYLRSVKSSVQDYNMEITRFTPLIDGKPVEYSLDSTFSCIKIITSAGNIQMTYQDDQTLLIKGVGKNLGLLMEYALDGRIAYTLPVHCPEGTYYKIHHTFGSSQHDRFGLYVQKGNISSELEWNDHSHSTCTKCNYICNEDNGEFLLAIHDMDRYQWPEPKGPYDFEAAEKNMNEAFQKFHHSMPVLPTEYDKIKELIAYIFWGAVVRPLGFLKRDTVLITKNVVCYTWGFEAWLIALGLFETDFQLAYDQLLTLFDSQNDIGGIPHMIGDTLQDFNHQMPPNIGYIVGKMMERYNFSRKQLDELYEKISRYTWYFLNYCDSDQNGLCEYMHGVDACNDDDIIFAADNGVTSPDLSTYMILQMDTLAKIATKLGRWREASMWEKLSAKMVNTLVETLFDPKTHLPFALNTYTKKRIDGATPLLFTPLMLGKRLPKECRDAIIHELKTKKYITPYGLASEAIDSPTYEANGFFRGPIWWTQTLSTVDGLYKCGEPKLARQLAKAYMDLYKNTEKMAECYNAETGEALKNCGYVSGSATFMILGRFYLDPPVQDFSAT